MKATFWILLVAFLFHPAKNVCTESAVVKSRNRCNRLQLIKCTTNKTAFPRDLSWLWKYWSKMILSSTPPLTPAYPWFSSLRRIGDDIYTFTPRQVNIEDREFQWIIIHHEFCNHCNSRGRFVEGIEPIGTISSWDGPSGKAPQGWRGLQAHSRSSALSSAELKPKAQQTALRQQNTNLPPLAGLNCSLPPADTHPSIANEGVFHTR